MKPEDTVKCPHCGKDPTSTPVTAFELVADLIPGLYVTHPVAYHCEACDGWFTAQMVSGQVEVKAAEQP
jgi:hypothetical protein